MTRDPLPPVLLSEVRSLGFPIILTCPVCVHTRVVQLLAFAGLPDALTVEDLGIPFDALGAGGRVARALTLRALRLKVAPLAPPAETMKRVYIAPSRCAVWEDDAVT